MMLEIFPILIILSGIWIIFKDLKNSPKRHNEIKSDNEIKPVTLESSEHRSNAPYKIEPPTITEEPQESFDVPNYAQRIEKSSPSKKSRSKKKSTKKNKL